MNLFRRTFDRLENVFIRWADDSKILIEAATRRGVSDVPSRSMKRSAKNMQAETLRSWKSAVSLATDPEEPSRADLSRLYDNLLLDNHLASVIDSRILYVQRSAFKLVDEKGQENKDISWMFERPWFDDLIRLVLNSRYQGTTLVELYETNQDGELAQVDEIPQSHFIATKGIVLVEPGDQSGWSYKEGPFANYYLQVGKDNDLGMLEKLAVIVLAKKLGLGSWLDYIEKFGIPPIFVTTDREDNTRLNELFEAASNFRANHFMVGRGQEKFEIGNSGGIDAYNTFDKLIERANNEISKRILGGAGLTDDKSFVGSSEIQYRLAKDRYESDKLFFKYIFNTHVKPRLIKLSPVYAPLTNFYFEWDNTESLSQIELVDMILKLAAQFDIEPSYVKQITGIPIIGQKQTSGVVVDNPNAEKKKPEPNALTILREDLTALYSTPAHSCNADPIREPVAISLEDWAKTIERVAKELHEGKLSPDQLDGDLIRKTYEELNKGAGGGYGKDWVTFGKKAGPDPAVLRMQQNLYRFSGAKTFAQLRELNDNLYHEGELKDWQDFKTSALKINEKYNLSHLQAEHQTAKQAGNHARNWRQYEEDKKLFPNLKYKTTGDSRVREDHKALEGIIAPIDSNFWDRYYPPNGWRCRCYVVQTAEKATRDIPEDVPEVKPEFRSNVGKGSVIFPEESAGGGKPHPYFALSKSIGNENLIKAFERSKLNAPPNKVYTSSKGAKLEVSPFADLNDLQGNYDAAVKIIDQLNMDVLIRPHVNLVNQANPNYEINRKMADRTAIKGYTGIKSAIDTALKQGAEHVVIDTSEHFSRWEPQTFYRNLKGKLNSYSSSKSGMVIVINGEHVGVIKMRDMYNGSGEPLEVLKKIRAGS
ncbi:hypothetical protein GFS24_10315 [Chitinophaga sp. SYP-B3965]|uniref:phage portal protein family protein n=1 Tax=Chitinophaga sp. SYP-B3965 TaxID=2663120 RepID=UPI0012998183|nr:DUF935 family protein [Chitinophaga sp. SYP-B3965]MRG45511.1 hypothetical protein [Chitinophaga sp. SYP-B3965]